MAGIDTCANCTKTPADRAKLLKCAKCINTFYCGKECQVADWKAHKPACRFANYIFQVRVCPNHITDPPVWRTMSCPAHVSFFNLHEALQVAFHWSTTHTFDFKFKTPGYKAPKEDLVGLIMQLKESSMATISGMNPTSKRPPPNLLRIVEHDPSDGAIPRFHGVHRTVDSAHNPHRWHSGVQELKAERVKLSKIFEDKNYQKCAVEYEYDFGDGWDHALKLVGREPATEFFAIKDGGGYPVAEDSGGWKGWNELIEAYRAKKPDEDQKLKIKWFEESCTNNDFSLSLKDREHKWNRGMIEAHLMVRKFPWDGNHPLGFSQIVNAPDWML